MNKKILCVLMSFLLLIGCFAVTVSAVEEKDVLVVLKCDDSKWGTFVGVNGLKTEGKGSLELPLQEGEFSFAGSVKLSKTIDISNQDTLAIDIYLTDPKAILSTFSEIMIEFTSCGTYDNAEIALPLHGDLKGYIPEMESGWNTAYFYFEAANRTSNPDEVDLTRIDFIRVFGKSIGAEGLSDHTMLIDNIRVCNTGGPSFEDLENLDQYRGDNSDVSVTVDDMTVPDVDNRHNEVTISQGEKLDASEKVTVTDNGLKQTSISVNPEDQPSRPSTPSTGNSGADNDQTTADGEDDLTLVLVVVICAAVLVIAVAVLVLVLVLTKTKKK